MKNLPLFVIATVLLGAGCATAQNTQIDIPQQLTPNQNPTASSTTSVDENVAVQIPKTVVSPPVAAVVKNTTQNNADAKVGASTALFVYPGAITVGALVNEPCAPFRIKLIPTCKTHSQYYVVKGANTNMLLSWFGEKLTAQGWQVDSYGLTGVGSNPSDYINYILGTEKSFRIIVYSAMGWEKERLSGKPTVGPAESGFKVSWEP